MIAASRNALLGQLPATLRNEFIKAGTDVDLDVGARLYDVGEELTHIYLPHTGLVSMVVVTEDGREVEAATIGREGAVGLSASGSIDAAFNQFVVRMSGQALRVTAAQFEAMISRSSTFGSGVARYREILARTCIQSVACNALHSTQRRCARWILTAYDHADGAKLPVTQSFLATMLGVKRNAVSRVAREFQELGLIRTRWGKVEVLNPEFLGDMACECYWITKMEVDKLTNVQRSRSDDNPGRSVRRL